LSNWRGDTVIPMTSVVSDFPQLGNVLPKELGNCKDPR
jgi:hypothetical protein